MDDAKPMSGERLTECAEYVRRIRGTGSYWPIDTTAAIDELVTEVRRLRAQVAPAAGRPELLCHRCEDKGAIPGCPWCRGRREAYAMGHAVGAALLGKLERLMRDGWQVAPPDGARYGCWWIEKSASSGDHYPGDTLAAAIEAAPDPSSEGGERGP